MKLKVLAVALLLPSAVAFSATNTVTFYGQVTDATCNVTVNSTSGDVSVQLPTIKATDLTSGAAATAGATKFNFVISGCTAGTSDTNVAIRLVPESTTTAGNLPNIASGAAANVEVQLVDDADTGGVINFATGGEYTTTPVAITSADADGNISVPFTAQYYATGTAGSGKVEGKVQYALAYD